ETLRPPFVRHASRKGKLSNELPLSKIFQPNPEQKKGPRRNLGFEGLTFACDGESLWVAMEAPFEQDGPVSTATNPGRARFTHFDRMGKVLGQYAYSVDALPVAP